jgi:hypothetical protein
MCPLVVCGRAAGFRPFRKAKPPMSEYRKATIPSRLAAVIGVVWFLIEPGKSRKG